MQNTSKTFTKIAVFCISFPAFPRAIGPAKSQETIFRNETYKVEQLVKKASASSQRLLRCLQSSSPPSLSLIQLADSTWDERAVCYFFDQYTCVDEYSEFVSHLGFLPPLYAFCRENEADNTGAASLRRAVDATALVTLGNQVKAPPLLLRAREYYGSALRGLRRALDSCTQAVKDETFATLVLLSLFEDIVGERLYENGTSER
ncbi:hypothetical protein ARAM_007498 [Aspergillus rambellii]|uniref:Uncharacterized protein n=1 Tax=Aspergillus rambellii TaxID=308745 RepID=A0A0F8VSL5_9EURO|nr:hypothetical protein ARAM_007498 [Aspergillus rambellii]